jgi:signal transduction histidine kinase
VSIMPRFGRDRSWPVLPTRERPVDKDDIDASGTVKALRRLILAALIIPALLFAAAVSWDRSVIVRGAEEDALKLTAVFQGQAENLFKGHKLILDLVVARLQDQDWDKIQLTPDLLHELETVDMMLDDTSAILVVDADGKTRATTIHSNDNEPMPSGDKACFLALQRGDPETCLSDPYVEPKSGSHLFSLTRRLEKNGKFSGMAQVAISADFIMNLWASALPHTADTISILRADGVILAQPTKVTVGSGSITVAPAVITEIKKTKDGIVIAGAAAGQDDRITVVRSIAGNAAYISLGLDRPSILASWYRDVIIYALVAIVSMTGIVLALGTALRRARTEQRAVARWQAETHERERAQDQLLQSQKMESLGKLTGGIAHDFNNLLTVIVGNVSMIEHFVEDPDGKRQLRNALKAGESAVSLTQRLLAFARKQDLQLQSVDLLHLVEGMRSLLLRTIGDNIRLVIDEDSTPWSTLVDPNQMELVILNLAINARDAMPDGGTLSITLLNKAGGRDAPHDLAPTDYVVLTVADTGIGMDEATLARARDPFFTTKGEGKGTGLGLSMMEGVVTQSAGATRLRSTPGQGTQVEVWLPRTKTPPTATVSRNRMRSAGVGETILVCDDNPLVLEFLCDALKGAGYFTIDVQSGRSALSALLADASIRFLVVDFAMPEMNGAALTSKVRELYPGLPILLITGNADLDVVQVEIAGVPILAKPFGPQQLADRVGELLKRTPVDA